MSAIPFTLASYKLLADNTLRVTIDIEPADAGDFLSLFHERGIPGAVARLQNLPAALYGVEARALRQSGFFRAPQVWRAIGPDAAYQDWCRHQPCVICGRQDYADGEGRCEYAHVRRSGEAGTGYKPEYSGVPLCHHHHQTQHMAGEMEALVSAGKVVANSDPQAAKDWFDRKRIECLQEWGWQTLKQQLGYAHWNECPPEVLWGWAADSHVSQYLPEEYYAKEGEV